MAGSGGGVYDESCWSRYIDVAIDGNTGTSSGGGIYNSYSYTTMTYVTIEGNRAGPGGWGAGAGIYTLQSRLIMTNALITGNTAVAAGGGIFLRCDSSNPNVAGILILTNGKITGNQGSHGGGLNNYFMAETSTSHQGYVCAVFTNVLVADNTAVDGSGRGGGIAIQFASVDGSVKGRFTNVTVAGNESRNTSADWGGGGVNTYNPNPGTPGSTASVNLAAHYDIRFTNSVIWGNTDTAAGTASDNIRDPFASGGYTGIITYIRSLAQGKTDEELNGSGSGGSPGSDNLDSGSYSITHPYLTGTPLLNAGDNAKYPPTTSASAAAAFLLNGLTGTWMTNVTNLLSRNLADAAAADANDTSHAIDYFLKSDVRSAVGARYVYTNAGTTPDTPDPGLYTGRIKNTTIDLGAYEE
ncbi:MAG: hypothetical protein LBK27_06870 [Treponema sp.]|nr:hypothetical protein [Treponema sp.]